MCPSWWMRRRKSRSIPIRIFRAAPRWSVIPAANACAGRNPPACLLGDKNLCKAAYYQAAPHHAYGRALKCSKEETMGLLAAVRQWYKRDHRRRAAHVAFLDAGH